ncbi:MAG TPA: sulfotransferase [Cyanobacteria bacterium UBA8803]|nr:sulfotransferase [Cyanobacteria bacterium UBA9273]HBL60234.1 sulfotransferase [Cyanobacteria bacterium UBA8803]
MEIVSNRPVFLVGCPRSGTTLLQSMLAAHPQIASFPESKFFEYLFPEYEPRRRTLGLASRRLRPMLSQFFKEIGYPEMQYYLPKFPQFIGQYTHKFVQIMDKIAKKQGKSIWLEKTPQHINYIEYIEKFIPKARIIHIIRNGVDVVASLYEMGQKYPNTWGSVMGKVDDCIEEWIRNVKISLRYLNQPNHTLVRYEHLVEDPQTVIANLCKFIGVDFKEQMLQDYRVVAKQLIRDREQWKLGVMEEIKNANSQKFHRLFNEDQQRYILKQLSTVNLPELMDI